jgi:hypothetical protein
VAIAKQGSNGIFSAEPSVINFGIDGSGPFRQTLRIRNVSNDVRRVHVLVPTSNAFSVIFNKKVHPLPPQSHPHPQGDLPPGFTEDLQIEYRPPTLDKISYTSDSVRIQSDGDPLVVPIHIFPTLSMANLPPKIDFGPVELASSAMRRFELKSAIGVAFQFRIDAIKSCPAFIVDPPEGYTPPPPLMS